MHEHLDPIVGGRGLDNNGHRVLRECNRQTVAGLEAGAVAAVEGDPGGGAGGGSESESDGDV